MPRKKRKKLLLDGSGRYPSFDEAASAARQQGFRTATEYRSRYWVDPLLPSNPNHVYAEWNARGKWKGFLHGAMPNRLVDNVYPTVGEAAEAARSLQIRDARDYRRRYQQDPHLPSSPPEFYGPAWKSWLDFLGKGDHRSLPRRKHTYSYAEAKVAVRRLGILDSRQYRARRKEDSGLPASPPEKYASEWWGWPEFVGSIRKK